jgi:pantetheine-phosphate adenylyltransferase
MIKGIYAGTFDPLTNGHLDIILRSLQFCNQLVVAIGINPNKKTMFNEKERMDSLKESLSGFDNIKVDSFQGLLVDYAKQIDAGILVRGIRSVSDFEYEIGLSNVNKVLAPSIETVFLPTSPELAIVSSSMVKEIARFGGDISKFVPEHVVGPVLSRFGYPAPDKSTKGIVHHHSPGMISVEFPSDKK